MSEDRRSPLPARARAVADAPVHALVARAEELAHRWALALLGARPLAEMTTVPLEDIARYAPALCASLARALASDEELAPLGDARDAHDLSHREGDPAVALSALSAGWDATAAVAHVEALRGVVWEAALEELRDPTARQVADLSDRLASVCAAALAYALSGGVGAERDSAWAGRAAPREQVLYSAPGPPSGGAGAVLIDERDEVQRSARARAQWRRDDGPPAAPGQARPQRRPRAADPPERGAARRSPRPLPWDTPLQPSERPPDPAAGPAAGGEDPAMRVSRGPGTPADRRSWRS
jgi:hypothetical protein